MMRRLRTTISLDADVLDAAKAIARVEGRSLGAVVSSLARRGLTPPAPPLDTDDGFPVFRVKAGSGPITDEMVAAAIDEP